MGSKSSPLRRPALPTLGTICPVRGGIPPSVGGSPYQSPRMIPREYSILTREQEPTLRDTGLCPRGNHRWAWE